MNHQNLQYTNYEDSNVEVLKEILDNMSFLYLSKDFQQNIIRFLGIQNINSSIIIAVAQKIVQINYEYKGQYERYFSLPHSFHSPPQIKDFIWKVFQKFQAALNQRRHFLTPQYNFIREPSFQDTLSKNNNNMSMFNMFLNVPDLKNSEEIQMFQRKMFEVFKKAMPTVSNSLNSMRKSIPQRFINNNLDYRPSQFYQSNNRNMGFSSIPNFSSLAAGCNKNINNSFMNQPSFMAFNNTHQAPLYNNNEKPRSSPFSSYFYPQNSNNNIQSYSQSYINNQESIIPQNKYASEKIIKNFQNMNRVNYFSESKKINMHDQIHRQEQFPNSQPRKLVKKDDQVSIFQQKNLQRQPQMNQIRCKCKQDQQKRCVYCLVTKIDPSHECKEVINITKIISNTRQSHKISIKKQTLLKIKKNKHYDIELRCIQIPHNNQLQRTIKWPSNFIIEINGQIIKKFEQNDTKNSKQSNKSLTLSSLIDIERQSGKIQIMIIKQRLQNEDQIYFQPIQYVMGTFIVQKHSVQYMRKYFNDNMVTKNIKQLLVEISQEECLVTPLDPLTQDLIVQPVRGNQCKHLSCFDFKAYLPYSMLSDKQKWKCPICKKNIKFFMRDQQFGNILAEIRSMVSIPQQIRFDKEGNYKVVYSQKSLYEGEQDVSQANEKKEINDNIHS